MPERIQLRRTKGWRMPPNTVKVDRSTRWGNPYQAGQDGDGDRAYLVRLYSDYLARPEQANLVAEIRAALRGKNLACWCPLDHQPCHADVLLSVANAAEAGLHRDPGSMGPLRCAECTCEQGGQECNWIKPGGAERRL